MLNSESAGPKEKDQMADGKQAIEFQEYFQQTKAVVYAKTKSSNIYVIQKAIVMKKCRNEYVEDESNSIRRSKKKKQ